MRSCSPLADDAETSTGTTGAAVGATGPLTPLMSQYAADSNGAEHAARASAAAPAVRTAPSLAWFPPPASRGSASPAVAAASTSPAPTIASARPGQAVTARPPPAGLTTIRLTPIATSRPKMAAPQPAASSTRCRENTSAATPAMTRPAVTHSGGRPGPPGLSSSSDLAGRSGLARPGCCTPTSSSSWAGCVASWNVQGTSRTGGTTATMPRLPSTEGRLMPTVTAASTAARTATTQINGTKAAAIAIVRPVAQAARLARLGGWVNMRPASRAISGSRAKTTAVPSRPAATVPIAIGSSA